MNEVESGTIVGRVEFTGGTSTRFVPAEEFRESADATVSDAGNGDAPEAIAERIRADLEADLEAAGTCDEVRDVVIDRARVLADVQPSPFDEQESGAVGDAMREVSRAAGRRMDELKCVTTGARSRFNRAFLDILDAVEQARPVAEREAEAFVEAWGDTDFMPRWTFRDIAEQIGSIVVEPTGRGAACRDILAALEQVANRLVAVRTARELLDTQQRGTASHLKDIADGKATELMDQLEAEGCFQRTEPDFELEDVRELWRDVSLAIIRPSADLGLEIEQFRRLIQNIQTPPSERVGTQRAVPGTEEEALRREGELSGVRIGGDGLLDDSLTVEFGAEASALRRFALVSKGEILVDGSGTPAVKVETGPVADIPAEDVVEQIREVVQAAVFLGEIDEGTRFGSYRTNEAGDALAEVRLNAGTPVRTDDVGDLVRRMKSVAPAGGPPEQVGEWELVDEEPLTWRRDGFLLGPPATVPRPGEVLAADFHTEVLVRQSQTRHHVDIRWTWDGEQETSRHADVTVGDTRQKAIDQAVEMMAANERFPD